MYFIYTIFVQSAAILQPVCILPGLSKSFRSWTVTIHEVSHHMVPRSWPFQTIWAFLVQFRIMYVAGRCWKDYGESYLWRVASPVTLLPNIFGLCWVWLRVEYPKISREWMAIWGAHLPFSDRPISFCWYLLVIYTRWYPHAIYRLNFPIVPNSTVGYKIYM